MAKKRVKYHPMHHIQVREPKPKPLSNREIQLALVENFVGMQRVLTNLTVKFEALSDNITRLLQLFEISARNFIQKTEEAALPKPIPKDKELLKKIDSLLDQNKTIARGLTLIEEKIRHKINPDSFSETGERPRPFARI